MTTSFVGVVQTNYVMQSLLKKKTEEVLKKSQNSLNKTAMKNEKRLYQRRLIEILVSKFKNKFTIPDNVYM